MLELQKPTWTDTVQRDPFRGILLSALAVVLLFLSPAARGLPAWLELDPTFTLVAFALAFQRIRQAAALEAGIVTAWDTVIRAGRDRRIDELLDGPYLLGAYLLPFASVSPIPFAAAWMLVEASAFGHLVLFLRAYGRFRADRGYDQRTDTRDALIVLLRWRRRQAAVRAGLVAILLVYLLVSVQRGSPTGVIGAWTWAMLLPLAVLLFLVDPVRSPLYAADTEAGLTVTTLGAGHDLDRSDLRRLEAILASSVDTGGVTAAGLAERVNDAQGHRLLVARLGDDPVGLLAYEVRDDVGFVWWLATDPLARRRGVATTLLEHARSELEQVRIVVTESDVTTAQPDVRAARLAALRLLDARRVVGVRWRSTTAGAWYSVFVIEPHGAVPDDELRNALQAAAGFSLRDEPDACADAVAAIAAASLRRVPVR